MKELFKNYRAFDSVDVYTDTMTQEKFTNIIETILDDDFEDDYFLVCVTNINQHCEDYCPVEQTFQYNSNYIAQIVGEFADGAISDQKERYLIFRVEAA